MRQLALIAHLIMVVGFLDRCARVGVVRLHEVAIEFHVRVDNFDVLGSLHFRLGFGDV